MSTPILNATLEDLYAATAIQGLIVRYKDEQFSRVDLVDKAFHYADLAIHRRKTLLERSRADKKPEISSEPVEATKTTPTVEQAMDRLLREQGKS